MPATPMVITLYDPETNEVKATYSRMLVPWKVLKMAVRLAKTMNAENMTEDDVDALAGMIVEVFGNQFSVQDLNEGADIGEMMTVLNTIIAKARGGMPNPTQPE